MPPLSCRARTGSGGAFFVDSASGHVAVTSSSFSLNQASSGAVGFLRGWTPATREMPLPCDDCALDGNEATAWGSTGVYSNEVADAFINVDKRIIGSGATIALGVRIVDGFNQTVKALPGGVATVVCSNPNVVVGATTAFIDSEVTTFSLKLVADTGSYDLRADLSVSAQNQAYLPHPVRTNNVSVVRNRGGGTTPETLYHSTCDVCAILSQSLWPPHSKPAPISPCCLYGDASRLHMPFWNDDSAFRRRLPSAAGLRCSTSRRGRACASRTAG